MDKMGYPRGLIRYSTENAVKGRHAEPDIMRHVLRPRTLVYSAILFALIAAFVTALYLRVPLKVDVIRDRAVFVRETSEGLLENVYRLQIMNTAEQPRDLVITATGIDGLQVRAPRTARVPAATTLTIPVTLLIEPGTVSAARTPSAFASRTRPIQASGQREIRVYRGADGEMHGDTERRWANRGTPDVYERKPSVRMDILLAR
jgi:polyferredoxin